MKFGTYFAYWEQDWNTSYLKYVKKVADLGFDVLEVGASGIVNMSDEELHALRKEAEKYNITLTAGIGLPKEYDVSSKDENVRQNGIQFMKKIIQALNKANIHAIGGTIYSYWPVDYSSPINKEVAKRQSIKSMKELANFALNYDVTLFIEVLNRFEQFLLNDAKEAVDYVEEIGRDNVKIMLDSFHMNIEEDLLGDAIRYTGKHLGHFHIGEANRKVPGKGHMPWDEIGQALRDIEYDGCVVMEPFVRPGGIVGSDIKVWRDLSENADEAKLDSDIEESLIFVKEKFLDITCRK
ncbi:sugar phosphate isomerase/epimerase [Pullulanibacillus sp. KACC 23026]|uniref:D-psicose 3-epimerase n=1 Tax=Pullulanibacillus sp. KACC 23026 TaxID=3028315 RepID=UPI0023B01CDE|nr:sugar phosphate isomerase/epimerase family protein [Pullulanibacillus sp. KACC 23026]WEG13351.1 sugar phosphate isomerase/epimerase [Pullulanibacillus sp. KACC 23026]